MTSLVEVEVARLRQRHPSWPRRIAFELAGRVSACGFETPPCVRVSLTAGGRTLGMARRETTDWFVAAESREVAEARAKIARQVRDLPVDAVETVVLLASELITNAVRHGVGPVWVRLSRTDDSIRIEVRDQSRDLPSMQPDDPTALGGRGLRLVNALSSSWGVVGRQAGKSVWFTFDA